MGDAFEADRWPLEMAVTWLACGDRRTCIAAAAVVAQRREFPELRWPTLGTWLAAHDGRARELESVPRSFYRKERRQGLHPIVSALQETARLLTSEGFSATGRRGSAKRARIPSRMWRSAVVADDRQLGMILQLPREMADEAWREIEVRAAPFKALKAKRGRRPAGLGASARLPRDTGKTKDRVRQQERKQHLANYGVPAPRKRGERIGRPRGSRNAQR